MLFKSCLLAVFTLAALTETAPSIGSHVLHEKRHSTAKRWVKRGHLDANIILPVRIGLKQTGLEKGHDFLMDVSHPDSPNYAKHWTAAEVAEAFSPSFDTVNTVRAWLEGYGIPANTIIHSDNKGWLAFDAKTSDIENLLKTSYHQFEDLRTGSLAMACDSYHLPKHIHAHIDYITPGVKLLAPTHKAKRNRNSKHARFSPKLLDFRPGPPFLSLLQFDDLSNCDVAITPACIKALYQVPDATKADSTNAMGIFEEGDFYAQQDLDLFFKNFTPSIPQGTHPTPQFIDGANAPVAVNEAGGESDLDFELAYPLIYPQNISLYQTDDSFYTGLESDSSGFLNTFLDALDGSYCTYSAFNETGNSAIDPVYPDTHAGGYKGKLQCGVYKPTNVISVSYGGQEDDLPASYQQRQCNEFMKLGLQGHSIFFASGDAGVAGPAGDDSTNGCLGNKSTVFSPAFPNSCPYITNVGATKVYPGKTINDPESAVNDPSISYSSGGGFSNIYPIPDYQKEAVATYFKQHRPSYKYYTNGTNLGAGEGVYNRAGRGYPDVAANGDNIAVFNKGRMGLSGGTSASTPIFASIINLINEERLAVGKNPVGFVNPTLYSNPSVLNDITNGTNPGCGTQGFSAVEGWDPVSGLGTPNYPKMLQLFLSLP